MEDEDEHRYFLDVDLQSLHPKEREKLNKRFVWAKAYHHFGEFVRLLLELLGKSSIELRQMFPYVIRAFREMEKKDVCYMKTMPNGRIRIFKEVYCCLELEDWRKCPEYRCPVWPYCRDSECPHDPHEDEVPFALENMEEVK